MAFREKQIKTIMRYYFIPIVMVIFKENNKTSKDVMKLTHISCENVKQCSYCRKSLVVPQKVNQRVTCDPAILSLGICLIGIKICSYKNLDMNVQRNITQNSQNVWGKMSIS